MRTWPEVPVLEATGLTSGYGAVTVIRDLDLRAYRSEAVAVIGPNGVGKSTLLRTLAGVLRPRRGVVLLNGRPLRSLSADAVARSGISLVPEGRALFPTLTVDDNLRIGSWATRKRSTSDSRERVYSLFPILAQRRRMVAGLLSGGEQQMLAVARALMGEPEALLLDEPSLGLAPKVLRAVLDHISELVERHLTVVIAEQNVPAALSIAARFVVLRHGEIVHSGKPADLGNVADLRELYL